MFAEVVFPLPFRNSFTYIVPSEFSGMAKIGVRAVAPFGKRVLTGFIINLTDNKSTEGEIKILSDIIDDRPIFTPEQLKFYKWFSEYYLCSLGEALRFGMPYGTEVESKKKIIPDQTLCKKFLSERADKNSLKQKILKIICDKEVISLSFVQKQLKRKNIYSAVRSLEKEGALSLIDEIEDTKVKVKTVKYIKLSKSLGEVYETLPELENRSPVQFKILLALISGKKKDVPLSKIVKDEGGSRSAVDGLVKKGLVNLYDKEIDRNYNELYSEESSSFKLTETQTKVVETVKEDIRKKIFQTFLLHGVTGSGKTQVYIELIKEALALKKTAMLLVPEISLTPQITSRLLNNFGDQVSVIHSKLSKGERYDAWRKILKGKSKVVIGARSALFAPLKNPGIIIVDEEHDSGYKQSDTAPRYHARDSAVMLGKFNKCPVILGSATPSIETMYNARTGKFTLVELPGRIDDAKMPSISLVNVSIEKKQKRMENVFSKTLINKITDRLSKKEGIIILQNRRGFSTQVYCEDCGETEICGNCSVPMVLHLTKNYIQCHYCGEIRDIPKVCSNCGSLELKYFGTGTERVEDELEYYFPNAKVKRIDSDSVSRKSSLSTTLLEFSKGDIDILVGTQMVSKGLDFPRVTLVGVIAAETTLWLPDFRADERTFQLLTQVAGRAGRSNIEGEVIIQTQNEKHFTLQKVISNDYENFYQHEIDSREKLRYPPFVRICLIETRDTDEKKAEGAINDFYRELIAYKKYLDISPPSTALIFKLKGNYRYHILIKSSREKDPGGAILRKAILEAYSSFNRKSRFRDIKLIYDIDPQFIF